MLRQDDYIKARLVEMGWRFGQTYGGGYRAGELVMHTLANRVRKGWGSWLQIIDSVPKYMAENELPKLEHPSIWTPEFIKLLHIVEGVYDGSAPDPTKPTGGPNRIGEHLVGALYWGTLSRIERPWFKDRILNARDPITGELAHHRVCNMNDLNFFN